MATAPNRPPVVPGPTAGAWQCRRAGYAGIFPDDFAPGSGWLRDRGSVRLPPLPATASIELTGEFVVHPAAPAAGRRRFPSLRVAVDGRTIGEISAGEPGPWKLTVPLPPASAARGARLDFRLRGVARTNTLAWLGRVTGRAAWQPFRHQPKNRQLRLARITTGSGEVIFDFGDRHSPFSAAFARRHTPVGLNLVGFFTADLGIGESARCMARAADAAGLPASLLDLRLNVKNRRGDSTFAPRLRETPEHDVSVFHLDPPAARDLDHHHGPALRAGRYNIAYWAWELPEFPVSWIPYAGYFDEIWCPSEFVREALAMAVPRPVLTMPHAIAFERPRASATELRARFGLPADRLLFLFLYDLNSYSERKNPRAVIEAFRASGLAHDGAALVIKTHSSAGNEADLAALQTAVADLPGTILINETLSRADLYALEAACDVFVSLHRSEGFGLAVAEAMYLGKPVIATNWSATAEFLTAHNGCPIPARLVTLDRNIGPYGRGQQWADPDVAAAAAAMRRLAADPTLRARLGDAARATIEQRFSPAVIGTRYRRRLEAIATF